MMDNIYAYDESLMLKIREEKAWLNDPKYFKRIKISPSACVKMISHGQSGVEKGIKKGGKPIEIMGMLVGRPDTEDRNCMIISDAQPLPIEGFETRVVADDESVINYMIELGESNEITKKDRFCGWYHTHPFDVDIHSQCFMSSTDISTQLQWQRAEDPFGNPWIAIVIDPLRSIANEKPELAAFRVYPPEYTAPANETPNGEIVTNDKFRIERWGAVWNRYYQLEMQFYMSSLTQSVIGVLKNKFSWKESISSTPSNEKDNQMETIGDINAICKSLKTTDRMNVSGSKSNMPMFRSFNPLENNQFHKVDGLVKASQLSNKIANTNCDCCASQLMKKMLFTLHKKENL